jgi:hypothetical protein
MHTRAARKSVALLATTASISNNWKSATPGSTFTKIHIPILARRLAELQTSWPHAYIRNMHASNYTNLLEIHFGFTPRVVEHGSGKGC